jgi:hypothetical protein
MAHQQAAKRRPGATVFIGSVKRREPNLTILQRPPTCDRQGPICLTASSSKTRLNDPRVPFFPFPGVFDAPFLFGRQLNSCHYHAGIVSG